MKLLSRTLLALTLTVTPLLTGCGRPFAVSTPSGFFELKDQESDGYAYRATSPEGVVLAVRVVEDDGRGTIAFWERAVTQKLRDERGYALLGTADVKAADGTAGRTLKFAHDEGGKPFDYWVTLFVANERLYLVEAGGDRALFTKENGAVEASLKSFRPR